MRTNIDIDDEMMAQAMRLFGTKTKKDTVAEALRRALAIGQQAAIRDLRGKFDWQGDLDALREMRSFDR